MNFFKSFIKPAGGGQQSSQLPGRAEDRLEDGFLLVGNTASERTTVHASSFQGNKVDAPPGYRDVVEIDGLPTYQHISHFSPTLDVTKHPDIQYGNPMETGSTTVNQGTREQLHQNHVTSTADANTSRTAISDLPFTLNASFGSSVLVKEIQNSNILYQQPFDISDYDYDFSVEMSILHEHRDSLMDVSQYS